MRFCDVFASYIVTELKHDAEAADAVRQFQSNIPGRVMQMDFDPSHSNKQGIKDGDRVFKLGLDIDSSTAFLEYFENYNQGQPTMAMYACREKKRLIVNGWKVDKRYTVCFVFDGKEVKKAVSTN